VLSDAEVERHSRQILLPEVGGRGQERLRASAVGVSVLDEQTAMREAALLGALHLAVAGVGRIVATGARGEILRRDLEALVRERNPVVAVAPAGRVDLEIGFGTVPETTVASLDVLVSGGRVGILASETGARCTLCRAALEAALGPVEPDVPALGPFLGALVATTALGRLLGVGGPAVAAFDLARAAALEATSPAHDCPARRRG
jgi:molybdopterin-synthase adenylyltransferase